MSYTETSQQDYFQALARENDKGQKQQMYDDLKKSADERRNPVKNKMLSAFENEGKGGSRGESGSVGGGAKRFKQSNYVYDAEVNGFPVR